MSDRSFEQFQDAPLLPGAAGDVLAARAVAQRLLVGAPTNFPNMGRGLLVLTALLLHCAILDGDGGRESTLSVIVTDMAADERLGPSLSCSSLQFVRYAAAELQSLSSVERRDFLRALANQISTKASLANRAHEKSDKNGQQVIY